MSHFQTALYNSIIKHYLEWPFISLIERNDSKSIDVVVVAVLWISFCFSFLKFVMVGQIQFFSLIRFFLCLSILLRNFSTHTLYGPFVLEMEKIFERK